MSIRIEEGSRRDRLVSLSSEAAVRTASARSVVEQRESALNAAIAESEKRAETALALRTLLGLEDLGQACEGPLALSTPHGEVVLAGGFEELGAALADPELRASLRCSLAGAVEDVGRDPGPPEGAVDFTELYDDGAWLYEDE